MSIFTKEYQPWYRIDKKVKHYCLDIKCAWQRATKGYCDRDIWDISHWFLDKFPKMLLELRDTSHGFPCDMESMDEWKKVLEAISLCFQNADEAKSVFQAKEFEDCKDFDEYCDWFNWASAQQTNSMKRGFELLSENFFSLWD